MTRSRTWHMRGPPLSPRQASRPPRSYPAQNMLSVMRYRGKNRVRRLQSLVDSSGSSTSCRLSAATHPENNSLRRRGRNPPRQRNAGGNSRKIRPTSKSCPHPTTVHTLPVSTSASSFGMQTGRTQSLYTTGSSSRSSEMSLTNPDRREEGDDSEGTQKSHDDFDRAASNGKN